MKTDCSWHRIYPNYSDKEAWANSIDPDQTPQIRVYTICHSSSNVLDTRTDGKMGMFKFQNMHGKVLRYPKTCGKYDNRY